MGNKNRKWLIEDNFLIVLTDKVEEFKTFYNKMEYFQQKML